MLRDTRCLNPNSKGKAAGVESVCMWMCVYMFVYAHTRAGAHAQMYVGRLTYQKPQEYAHLIFSSPGIPG